MRGVGGGVSESPKGSGGEIAGGVWGERYRYVTCSGEPLEGKRVSGRETGA